MKKILIMYLSVVLFLIGCGRSTESNYLSGMLNFKTLTFFAINDDYERYMKESSASKQIDELAEYFNEEDMDYDEIEYEEGEEIEDPFIEVMMSNYIGNTDFLTFLAQKDLKYHFQWADSYTFLEHGAATNIQYNISYLINIPAKIKQNYQFNKAWVNGEVSNDFFGDMNEVMTKYGDVSLGLLVAYDIFYAITGAILAVLTGVFGSIFSIFIHPIASLWDIPSEINHLIDSFKTAMNVFK